MSRCIVSSFLLSALTLSGQGCFSHRKAVTVPPPAARVAALQGVASITILTSNAAASASEGATNEEIVAPRPIGELQRPIYPEKALKANHGHAVIAVRVFLDASGRVTEIKDAPGTEPAAGNFPAEFRQAVEEAIHKWRFQPAESHRYADGKDLNGDGKPDYKILKESRPVPVHFDVRFDFSILDGQGQVR